MSVIGEFLGFDGRVSRLGLVWRSALMGGVLALLAALTAWALATYLHPAGVLGGFDDARQVITGAVLLALWSGFALASRRLRDIGVEPAHVVPFYAALWVCNAVLLEPMSRADPHRFGPLEQAWRALQLLLIVPLVFWPPKPSAPRAPGPYDEAPQPTAYLNWRESG